MQGGPGTGKTAVGLHRAAWLLYADPALARSGVLVVGPNRDVHRLHLQGLPALGEQSVEQRPIDALVSVRPRSAPEPEAQAALLGSGRMATLLARLLWSRVTPPRWPRRSWWAAARSSCRPPRSRRSSPTRASGSAPTTRAGRASGSGSPTGSPRARGGRARAGLVSPAEVASAVRGTKAFQRLATRCWPRQTPEALVRAVQAAAASPALADGLLAGAELDELIDHGPPGKAGAMPPSVFALLDEAAG